MALIMEIARPLAFFHSLSHSHFGFTDSRGAGTEHHADTRLGAAFAKGVECRCQPL